MVRKPRAAPAYLRVSTPCAKALPPKTAASVIAAALPPMNPRRLICIVFLLVRRRGRRAARSLRLANGKARSHPASEASRRWRFSAIRKFPRPVSVLRKDPIVARAGSVGLGYESPIYEKAGGNDEPRALVPDDTSLGADQFGRVRSGPLRRGLVARALAEDAHPGGDHQRRRHRRLLSLALPAAPPRREAGRPRLLWRDRRRRPGGGADGARPDGFEPGGAGLLRGASRLDLPRHPRRPVPAGRQVRDLHRFTLLYRVPARGDGRDHRAQPSGWLHRQQLGGAAAGQHLLLRPLQGAVRGLRGQGLAPVARLGGGRLSR